MTSYPSNASTPSTLTTRVVPPDMNVTQTLHDVAPHHPDPADGPCSAGQRLSLQGAGVRSPSLWATTPATSMTWTTWPRALSHQEHVASGGVTTHGTWHGFAKWVEREHANGVWAKGRGPQWSPMAAMEGRRRIEYTAYMSAVTLDCDGAGDWDQLTSQLDSVGAAYLLHRSSSHTPSKPKWRLVLPLAALFRVGLDVAGNKQDTRGPNRVWHGIYYAARVLIGELAGFADPASGDAEKGFDPATKSTAQAFYLGHRRAEDEPLCEVIWRDGFALDGAVPIGDAPVDPSPVVIETITDP